MEKKKQVPVYTSNNNLILLHSADKLILVGTQVALTGGETYPDADLGKNPKGFF